MFLMGWLVNVVSFGCKVGRVSCRELLILLLRTKTKVVSGDVLSTMSYLKIVLLLDITSNTSNSCSFLDLSLFV